MKRSFLILGLTALCVLALWRSSRADDDLHVWVLCKIPRLFEAGHFHNRGFGVIMVQVEQIILDKWPPSDHKYYTQLKALLPEIKSKLRAYCRDCEILRTSSYCCEPNTKRVCETIQSGIGAIQDTYDDASGAPSGKKTWQHDLLDSLQRVRDDLCDNKDAQSKLDAVRSDLARLDSAHGQATVSERAHIEGSLHNLTQMLCQVEVRIRPNCRWVPPGPKGVDIAANINEAIKSRSKPFMEKIDWFKQQVGPKMPWDYKRRAPQVPKEVLEGWGGPVYEEFGNFHFGVVGAALFSPGVLGSQLLKRGAGKFQKDTKPEWGHWWDPLPSSSSSYSDLLDFIDIPLSSYGDAPWDQEWIERGIQFYKECVEEVITPRDTLRPMLTPNVSEQPW